MGRLLILILTCLLTALPLSAQTEQLGKWATDEFTTEWAEHVWEFDASKFVEGKNCIKFTYTSGAHKLCLKDVNIIADGKTVLTDSVELSAGSNPKSAIYVFNLDAAPNTLILTANVRTAGGTNSNGTITGGLYEPEPRVEANSQSWNSGDFMTNWKEYFWEFDASSFVKGSNTITFLYTSGSNKLCLKDVNVIADGKCVLADSAEMSAGTNPKSITYLFDLDAVPTTLTLTAAARTVGGTSSKGIIYINGVLYIPEGTTEIGGSAYYGNKTLKKVVIPSTVTKIGSLAFHSCTNLEEVYIPSSVTTIGNAAFQNDSALTKVTLHEGLTNMPYRLFKGTSIREITIPSTVMEFGSELFSDSLTVIRVDKYSDAHAFFSFDKRLTFTDNEPVQSFEQWLSSAQYDILEDSVLYIKPGTTAIKANAYKGNTRIKRVVFPTTPTVTEIGKQAFADCGNLEEIDIPSSVTTIGESVFQNDSLLAKVTLHEGLSNMPYRLFRKTAIREITIPSTVTELGSEIFSLCDSLTVIRVDKYSEAHAFFSFDKRLTFTDNEPVQSFEQWCDSARYDILEDSVLYIKPGTTAIKANAYKGNARIKRVVFPATATVTEIGKQAFADCGSLEEIDIPSSVTTIGESVFQNDSLLTKVTLHEGLTNMPYRLFRKTAIREITIPSTVTELGSEIFSLCDSLTVIRVDKYSEAHAFFSFDKRLTLTGNDPVQSFEQWLASARYDILEDSVLYIKPGTTAIKANAYKGNARIKRVVFPATPTVTEIGKQAFADCGSLEEIDIPSSVTTIGDATFQNCTSLTGVSLPEELTSLNARLFKGAAIREITIPSTVTMTGNEAFSGCDSLRHIYLTTNIEDWGKSTFPIAGNLVFHFVDIDEVSVVAGSVCYTKEGSKMEEIASLLGIKKVKTNPFLELLIADSLSDGQYEYYTMIQKMSLGTFVRSIEGNPFPSSLISLRNYNNPYVDEWVMSHGWYLVNVTDTYREYSKNKEEELVRPSYMTDGDEYWSGRQYKFDDSEVNLIGKERDTLHSVYGKKYSANKERQNYYQVSAVSNSYLTEVDNNLLMLVNVGDSILIEYFTSQFESVATKKIARELPSFGGFFASRNGSFYVVQGQNNSADSDEVETFRIIQYDKDWNRVNALSLFGCNTSQPFSASQLTMMESDDFLFVRTAHGMYKGSDGVSHQANVFLDIDKRDLSLVYKQTGLGGSYIQYASHSFNQLQTTKNGFYAGLDHGDAYPRAIIIGKNKNPISENVAGSYYSTRVCNFPGETGDNYTGASVGGFTSSETHFLTAYVMVDTAHFKEFSNPTRNLYITATPDLPDGFGEHIHRQVTTYPEGSESVRTPHLVKYGKDDFLLLWSMGDEVFYMHVGGDGTLGEQYSFEGHLSSCVPILYNGYVTWYVTDGKKLTFYRIDTKDISKNETLEKSEVEWRSLKEIVCMDTIESPSSIAFQDLYPNVQSVIVDGSVSCISSRAFQGAQNLTKVVIESGVRKIDNNAFQNTGIERIEVPESVTTFGKSVTSKNVVWVVKYGSAAFYYAMDNNYSIELLPEPEEEIMARIIADGEKADPASTEGWETGDFLSTNVRRRWDFSDALKGGGDYKITFKYTSGACRLCLEDALFVADGEAISYIPEMRSAGSNPRQIVYEITVPAGTEKLELYAFAKTGGGTDSYGTIKVDYLGGSNGIDDAQVEGYNIYVLHRTIVVENANADICVYDISGRLVACRDKACLVSTVAIPVPAAGIYIVETGGVSQKVLVE
ncbi:MAG: leucine-rich repeat protein [Paludibacteraceae bacterium]|nr:leucine-rich repeat protein [Paludibacteraceae bacterium]